MMSGHARTNRKTTFSCKEDWGKSLHVYWSGAKVFVKNQDRTRPELTQP